jgi:glycosyl transferase, family 25
MLPIYVINLASSSARRERISARLNELKIPFEIFPAVDGRAEPHSLLWNKCVELNHPILVMEDDVVIDELFTDAYTLCEEILNVLCFLRLHGTGTHRRPFKEVAQFGDYTLRDYVRGPTGALCYALTPNAARALMANAESWYMAVDDYIDRYWIHKVDSFALAPYRISVGNNKSDIDRPTNQKSRLIHTLRHEIGKRYDRFLRLLYRLKHAHQKTNLIKQCTKTIRPA